MSEQLAKFSDEQLKAELARRKNQDWYFAACELDENDTNEYARFNITHKRQYHIHHELFSHIGHFISVPEEFYESMESEFDYKGKTQEGVKLLAQYGFTELQNPFFGFDSMTQYFPLLKSGPRITLTSDTAEIKQLLDEWIAKELPAGLSKLPSDWSKDVYLSKIKKFTATHKLVDILNRDDGTGKGGWNGADISLLPVKVYESLPQFPKDYHNF